MCSLFQNCGTNASAEVTVIFLDDTTHTFEVEKYAKSKILFNQVYKHLDLVEDYYFGLQYFLNGTKSVNNKPEHMRWLNDSKSIKSQIKTFQNPLYFRVRFYVFNTCKLGREQTLQQFYLQVRKDIMEERLHLSTETSCVLASYMLQVEFGDYQLNPDHLKLLSSLQTAANHSEDAKEKILELYKMHKHQTASKAELNFLDQSMLVDTYGVELYKAKDSEMKHVEVGATFNSLLIFQSKIKIHYFATWSNGPNISFGRKNKLSIQFKKESPEFSDTSVSYYLESSEALQFLTST